MNTYKRLYPLFNQKDCYISNLHFDDNFKDKLYSGVSLKKMKAPVALLKNINGKKLDFLYTLGGKLVISEKVKLFLESTNDSLYFEFINVNFENARMKPYFLLNILELVNAFDWDESDYELFEELGPKGNKVIRKLIKMEINESKTNNRKLFNMLNFEGNTIIHDDLLAQMIDKSITGMITDPLVGHK